MTAKPELDDVDVVDEPRVPVVGDEIWVWYRGQGPFAGWVTGFRHNVPTITALYNQGNGVLVVPAVHFNASDAATRAARFKYRDEV